MTRYMTAGAAALATSLALGTAALADTTPDLRGTWVGSYTTVQPSHYYKGDQPRFNQAEWMLDVQMQEDNVFWGPSKWRRDGDTEWNEYEATGTIRNTEATSIPTMVRPDAAPVSQPISPIHGKVTVSGRK